MTELELYKFIHNNAIEWHKQDNDGTPDVVIFVHYFYLPELFELLKKYDESLECRLKENYFALFMGNICDNFGIDIENLFIEN